MKTLNEGWSGKLQYIYNSMNKFGCKLFGFLILKCFNVNTILANVNRLDGFSK